MVDATDLDFELFGRSIGRLVADGNRLVFHAADQAFHELDRRSFSGVIEAEKAVHEAWVRRMHRCASAFVPEVRERVE